MKALLAKIRAILRDRKTRRLWTRIISATACLVVFVSTYALILPAITMEREAACGMEAHQHSDECYEEMLTCGLEQSEEHQHTEACYEQVLVCGKEPHIHSEACYRQDSAAAAAAEGTSVPVDNAQGDTQNSSQAGAQNSEPDDTQAGAQGEAGNDTQTDTQNGAQDDAQIIVPDQAGLPSDSVEIDITDGQENAGMVDMETDFRDGTLTVDGDGYHITLDYTAKAQIPETASLSVKEITPDTDPEAYETCLQQAAEKMGAGLADSGEHAAHPANSANSSDTGSAGKGDTPILDTAASRFFDIEIVDTDEAGNTEKIEPAAPVAVNIRLSSTVKEAGTAREAAVETYNGVEASGQAEQANSAAASASSDPTQNSDPTVLHFAEEGVEEISAAVEESPASGSISGSSNSAADQVEEATAISFEAESFSIYGVVYTVDFEYSVNGKMYQFSLPGGGFVSFTDLVEVLGITSDTNSEENRDENGSVSAENAEENVANEGAEENGVNSDTNTPLTIGDVEVSEVTRKFVGDVASVEFSSPELVDVSKVEADTTVGQIKESRGLECEYSAKLTEEQIAEIDAQTVKAGDWALISVRPFNTEETLTVTMKDGEIFVIRVTDAQFAAVDMSDFVAGNTNHFIIWSTAGNDGKPYALKADGTTAEINPNQIDSLGAEFQWTVTPGTSGRYIFRPVSDNSKALVLQGNHTAGFVNSTGNPGIYLYPPNTRHKNQRDNDYTSNNSGWILEGWDWTRLNLGWTSHQFESHNQFCSDINITKQNPNAGMIALSPMNENGILPGSGFDNNITSTHYKNMTIDGYTIDNNNDANLERSRMYIPVQYNNDGTATITLPSNDQLGSFSVSSADSVTHSITQDPNKYQWKLHGWVNIATGVYYDVTNGPVSVAVSRDNLNVFYADWWAADYNYTIPEAQRADTVDTSSFVNIKMWDYNEMYNLRNSTAYKPDGDAGYHTPRNSIESEEWYIDGGSVFQFVDNTDSGNCWQYGSLGNTQWRNRYNPNWSLYDGTGILNILGTQGQVPSTGVLESLFPASVTPGSGVNYLGQGNYLFSYNETTKTYSYDSNYNGAVYNQSEGKFYVSTSPRDNHWRGGGGGYREDKGFFPLNDATSRIEYNNGTTNNWFGMSIDLDFWLPDAPGSSTDANKLAGHNMRFDFTGDDDVWVLIDGKLALDIGGIHEAVSGYIDFSTGKIRNAKGNEYDLSAMGIGAGAHTLSFYYLERGGNASNCKITFNIVPRWDDEPEKYGEVSVTKTWSDDTPEDAKQSLTFSLQTSDGTPVEGTEVVYTDGTVTGNIWRYEWDGLDPDQDYKVVEGEDPYFLVSSESEVTEIKNCWAAASYHKNQAFGSNNILLGNNRTSAAGGKLLNGNGGSDNADFVDHIVKSTVTDNEKWTVEGYDSNNQHFYLKNSSGSYLSIKNGSITLVNNASYASLFYMSPSGDLNDANSDYRLRVNEDGSIGVGTIVNSADETSTNSPDRIHIYRFFEGNFAKRKDYSFVNKYILLELDVLKVEKGKETSTMLPGAVFELRKLEDVAPTNPGGTLTYVKDNNQQVVVTSETTGDDGRLTFSDLTYGVYEIREVTPPPGYIHTEDVIFYLKVDGGVITYVQKGSNKPSVWTAASNSDGATVYFMEAQAANPDSTPPTASANATFRVGNTPGAALPNTGGPGTRLFTILGSILILGAGVLLLRRRRLI